MTLPTPPVSGVVPVGQVQGDTPQDTRSLHAQSHAATEFLRQHDWCAEVVQLYSGLQVPDVFGLFLAQIRPTRKDVDNWLWVVVGDVPPAYLVLDDLPTPLAALERYLSLFEIWCRAVENGEPIDDLVPANAPATALTAVSLRRRLEMLRQFIREEGAT